MWRFSRYCDQKSIVYGVKFDQETHFRRLRLTALSIRFCVHLRCSRRTKRSAPSVHGQQFCSGATGRACVGRGWHRSGWYRSHNLAWAHVRATRYVSASPLYLLPRRTYSVFIAYSAFIAYLMEMSRNTFRELHTLEMSLCPWSGPRSVPSGTSFPCA